MSQQTIGIGSAANDGTGDPLRTAFSKVNSNFTELYNQRPQVIAASGVQVSHTGDTVEFTFATITIPANVLGPNGWLEVETVWTHTNSANNKTMNVKYGGTAYGAFVDTTSGTVRDSRVIQNRNATNSQVGAHAGGIGGWGPSSGALLTSAVDTTASSTLTITGQLALGTETLALQAYRVTAFYAP